MAISSTISSRSRIISFPKNHFHGNYVATANLSLKLAAAVPLPAPLRLRSSARFGLVACLKHENTEEKSTEEDVDSKSDHRKAEKSKEKGAAGALNKDFLMTLAYYVATTSLAQLGPLDLVFVAVFGVIWKILLKIKSHFEEEKSIEEDVVAQSDLSKEAAGTGAMYKKFFKYFLMASACYVTASLANSECLLIAIFNEVQNMLPIMKLDYEEHKWLIEVIKLVNSVWNFIRKMKERAQEKKNNAESTSGSKKN